MTHKRPTIAVLPIQSFLDQPSDEYIADGMTELLISELGRLNTIRVVSMASALKYKGSEASYQEIGQGLGAEMIVDASFMKTEETLRLRVELHEAQSKTMRLRESYEEKFAEVYTMLADIVKAIGVAVGSEPPPNPEEPRRVDSLSFDNFLQGLHHWSRSTEGDYKQAIQCYIESLKQDPGFGAAYGLLAACYGYLGFWGHLPLKQVYPRSKLAAEKALEMDSQSVEAHSALALVHWLYDWDLAAAQAALNRTLEMNPSHATAHWIKGIFLGAVREKTGDALAEMNQVREIDPASPMPDTGSGWIHYWGRQFEEANEHFTKTLEANESVISAWQGRGLAKLAKNEFDDALIAFTRALDISADPYSQGLLGLAYGRSGNIEDARRKLDDLQERSQKEWVPSLAIAWIYLGLGETEECFGWLAKAVEERDPQIFWLKAAALYDPLRSDPRLDELLEKIGFI